MNESLDRHSSGGGSRGNSIQGSEDHWTEQLKEGKRSWLNLTTLPVKETIYYVHQNIFYLFKCWYLNRWVRLEDLVVDCRRSPREERGDGSRGCGRFGWWCLGRCRRLRGMIRLSWRRKIVSIIDRNIKMWHFIKFENEITSNAFICYLTYPMPLPKRSSLG